MANDAPIVHIGQNSPEYIAYLLMADVNGAESHPKRTREQILNLYAECILAVRVPASRKK